MEKRLFYTPYEEEKTQAAPVETAAAPAVQEAQPAVVAADQTASAAQPVSAPTQETAPTVQTAKPVQAPTLDELLHRNTAYQTAFDQAVQKELDGAKSKWELEKTMTAEQLANAKTKEKEDLLVKREQSIASRERKTVAMELLAAKKLPAALIECVNLTDDFSMNESIKALENAFRLAVQEEVKGKLAGSAPKETPPQDQSQAHITAVRKAAGLESH